MAKRIKVVKTFEDFQPYLNEMMILSESKHCTAMIEMQKLITQARLLDRYDETEVNSYFDKIEKMRINEDTKSLDNIFNLIGL
jgi:hypothetical protein